MLTINELLNLNAEEQKTYHSTLRNNYYNNKNNQSLDSFTIDPVTYKQERDIDSDDIKKVSSSIKKMQSPPIQEDIKFVYHSYGKSSSIDKSKPLSEILGIIKNGDSNLPKLLRVRNLGKSHPDYVSNKIELPTVRFNFLFKDSVSNANIIGSTGVIYIDIDGCDFIDTKNPLILASWKSLSLTGFGILVKVSGLTPGNFSDTYNAISNELGLPSDIGARKPSQANIISYDPNIYINYDSIVFTAIQKVQSTRINEKQKVQSTRINEINRDILCFDNNNKPYIIKSNDIAPQGLEREKKTFRVDCTLSKCNKNRFNNISDYFVGENKDKDYIVFDKKEMICRPYLPKNIPVGKRNTIMYFNLSMYAGLNPECNHNFLLGIANRINDNFIVKYPQQKINSIVASVLKQRDNGTLELLFNEERLILFNPDKKLLQSYKNKIIGQVMGKRKIDKTQSELYKIIEQWDFDTYGEINQNKVAEQLSKSLRTTKSHWHIVKELVQSMNQDFKNGIKYNKIDKMKEPTTELKTIDLNDKKNEMDTMPIQEEINENDYYIDEIMAMDKALYNKYMYGL